MSADDNIKTVQSLYEAFGRGDVGTILDAVADDVDWGAETTSTAAPWYGVRRGKSGVASFFEGFGSTMEVDEFTPLTFAGNDDSVLSVVRCRTRARATGKSVDMHLHHYFRFSNGRVVYYRGTEDTAQVEAALRA
ncbi:MAG TPA: nuclear transport factor 2 family protein [Acidimicrobiales bacterium]|nr:nuclear transport factor 2 family protein [Acidimicrobiales bacterium]